MVLETPGLQSLCCLYLHLTSLVILPFSWFELSIYLATNCKYICLAQFSPVKSRFVYLTAHWQPPPGCRWATAELSIFPLKPLLPVLPISVDDSPILPLPEAKHPGDTLDSSGSLTPTSNLSAQPPGSTFKIHPKPSPPPRPPPRSPPPAPSQAPPSCFCPRRDELFPTSPPEGGCENLSWLPSLSRAFPWLCPAQSTSQAPTTANTALHILIPVTSLTSSPLLCPSLT